MEPTEKDRRHEGLSAVFFGDVREDARILGLIRMKDFLWTLVSLVIGSVLMMLLFFLPGIVRLTIWASLVFFTFIFNVLDVPVVIKRHRAYRKIPKETEGTFFLQDVEEEGAFYRAGQEWSCVFSVEPPPWAPKVLNEKQQLIHVFQQFLRSCSIENIVVQTYAQEIPDLCIREWEEWEAIQTPYPKVEEIKQNRLRLYRQMAYERKAMGAAYYLRLVVQEQDLPDVKTRRDGEQRKKEIKKGLQKIIGLVDELQTVGIECRLISGLNVVEELARELDPFTWLSWVIQGSDWSESPVPHVEPDDDPVFPNDAEEASKGANKTEEEDLSRKQKGWSRVLRGLEQWGRKWGDRMQQVRRWTRSRTVPKQEPPAKPVEITVSAKRPEVSSVLFTSPVSSGKTFLASNVAAAWALEGKETILIDGDIKNRGVHTHLNLPKNDTSIMTMFHEQPQGVTPPLIPQLTVYGYDPKRPLDAEHQTQWESQTGRFLDQLEFWLEERTVVMDLPIQHPLFPLAAPLFSMVIGVLDEDYHHLLQWTLYEDRIRSLEAPMGFVLNQYTGGRFQQLAQKMLKAPVDAVVPFQEKAKVSIQYGRPLALTDPDFRQYLQGMDWRSSLQKAKGGEAM